MEKAIKLVETDEPTFVLRKQTKQALQDAVERPQPTLREAMGRPHGS